MSELHIEAEVESSFVISFNGGYTVRAGCGNPRLEFDCAEHVGIVVYLANWDRHASQFGEGKSNHVFNVYNWSYKNV